MCFYLALGSLWTNACWFFSLSLHQLLLQGKPSTQFWYSFLSDQKVWIRRTQWHPRGSRYVQNFCRSCCAQRLFSCKILARFRQSLPRESSFYLKTSANCHLASWTYRLRKNQNCHGSRSWKTLDFRCKPPVVWRIRRIAYCHTRRFEILLLLLRLPLTHTWQILLRSRYQGRIHSVDPWTHHHNVPKSP